MEYLRKCVKCGFEAKKEEDLKLFAVGSKNKFRRRNLCKKCFNKEAREYRKRRFDDKGLCRRCGEPNDRINVGGKYCSRCVVEFNEYSRKRHWALRKRAIEKLGGICVACGIVDLRLLTINHKNGRRLRRTKDAGDTFYYRILDGRRKIDDLEIRCYNCNVLYEFEKGYRSLPKAHIFQRIGRLQG